MVLFSFLTRMSFHVTGTLMLSANALTGPIPESIGGLENLDILDLHQNELTGTIPANITSLADCSKFVLSLVVSTK